MVCITKLSCAPYDIRPIKINTKAGTLDNYFAFHFTDFFVGEMVDWQLSTFSIIDKNYVRQGGKMMFNEINEEYTLKTKRIAKFDHRRNW